MANYGGTSAATATGTPVSLAFLFIGVWTGLLGILLKSFTASCAEAELTAKTTNVLFASGW